MKEVLRSASKFVFGVFAIAIIAVMMTFTYGGLHRIFGDNIAYVLFGLVLFDIATLCWGIAFIFQSRSVTQYAVAAIGFAVGLVGTLAMIGAEVMLTGMTPEQIAASPIPTWMRYGFIIVVAIHVVLVYVHHGADPEIAEEINNGVMVGKVIDEGHKKAQQRMDVMSDYVASQLMIGTLDNAMRLISARTGQQVFLPRPPQVIDAGAQDAQPHFTTTCLICGKPTQGIAYCSVEHYNILKEMADTGKQAPGIRPAPKPEPAKDEPAPAPVPLGQN